LFNTPFYFWSIYGTHNIYDRRVGGFFFGGGGGLIVSDDIISHEPTSYALG